MIKEFKHIFTKDNETEEFPIHIGHLICGDNGKTYSWSASGTSYNTGHEKIIKGVDGDSLTFSNEKMYKCFSIWSVWSDEIPNYKCVIYLIKNGCSEYFDGDADGTFDNELEEVLDGYRNIMQEKYNQVNAKVNELDNYAKTKLLQTINESKELLQEAKKKAANAKNEILSTRSELNDIKKNLSSLGVDTGNISNETKPDVGKIINQASFSSVTNGFVTDVKQEIDAKIGGWVDSAVTWNVDEMTKTSGTTILNTLEGYSMTTMKKVNTINESVVEATNRMDSMSGTITSQIEKIEGDVVSSIGTYINGPEGKAGLTGSVANVVNDTIVKGGYNLDLKTRELSQSISSYNEQTNEALLLTRDFQAKAGTPTKLTSLIAESVQGETTKYSAIEQEISALTKVVRADSGYSAVFQEFSAITLTVSGESGEVAGITIASQGDDNHIILDADKVIIPGELMARQLSATTIELGDGASKFFEDGSGWLAQKNITWDRYGTVSIAGKLEASDATAFIKNLNTQKLTVGGGTSEFDVDGSGWVANKKISWNKYGSLNVKSKVNNSDTSIIKLTDILNNDLFSLSDAYTNSLSNSGITYIFSGITNYSYSNNLEDEEADGNLNNSNSNITCDKYDCLHNADGKCQEKHEEECINEEDYYYVKAHNCSRCGCYYCQPFNNKCNLYCGDDYANKPENVNLCEEFEEDRSKCSLTTCIYHTNDGFCSLSRDSEKKITTNSNICDYFEELNAPCDRIYCTNNNRANDTCSLKTVSDISDTSKCSDYLESRGVCTSTNCIFIKTGLCNLLSKDAIPLNYKDCESYYVDNNPSVLCSENKNIYFMSHNPLADYKRNQYMNINSYIDYQSLITDLKKISTKYKVVKTIKEDTFVVGSFSAITFDLKNILTYNSDCFEGKKYISEKMGNSYASLDKYGYETCDITTLTNDQRIKFAHLFSLDDDEVGLNVEIRSDASSPTYHLLGIVSLFFDLPSYDLNNVETFTKRGLETTRSEMQYIKFADKFIGKTFNISSSVKEIYIRGLEGNENNFIKVNPCVLSAYTCTFDNGKLYWKLEDGITNMFYKNDSTIKSLAVKENSLVTTKTPNEDYFNLIYGKSNKKYNSYFETQKPLFCFKNEKGEIFFDYSRVRGGDLLCSYEEIYEGYKTFVDMKNPNNVGKVLLTSRKVTTPIGIVIYANDWYREIEVMHKYCLGAINDILNGNDEAWKQDDEDWDKLFTPSEAYSALTSFNTSKNSLNLIWEFMDGYDNVSECYTSDGDWELSRKELDKIIEKIGGTALCNDSNYGYGYAYKTQGSMVDSIYGFSFATDENCNPVLKYRCPEESCHMELEPGTKCPNHHKEAESYQTSTNDYYYVLYQDIYGETLNCKVNVQLDTIKNYRIMTKFNY